MEQDRIQAVNTIMPPEGTDLVEFFAPGAEGDEETGLIREDATVKMTARSAEREGVGREGFRENWADWLEPWQSYRIYYDDLLERGDRVVALVRLRGVTKHDGVEMEHEAAAIFRFEGSEIAELEFSLDREDALGDD